MTDAGGAVSTEPADVRLRRTTDADWGMIRRWLAEPAVIRWWGPKATTEAEVMLAMGSSAAMSRIIEVDRKPVGYAHALDLSLLGEPLLPGVSAGTWDIDLFVASAAYRGRGVGARALELLRDEVFETTLAPAVSIVVGVGNEGAVRAYEKAGFRWRAVVRDVGQGARAGQGAGAGQSAGREPEWLMTVERPNRTRGEANRLL